MSSSSSSSDSEEEKDVLKPLPLIPHENPQLKSMDDFIKLGWYCNLILLAAEGMTMTCLSSMVYMVYSGMAPDIVSCGNVTFNSNVDACKHLGRLVDTTKCVPRMEYQFESVNVEFGLLCESTKQVKNSISYQMAGVLIGALLGGQASDLLGRKKVLLFSLTGLTLFSFANGFVSTFWQFTTLRVISGLFTGGLSAVQGVFLIENIPKKDRMWINTVITWSPNFILFPPIAYLAGNWRNLCFFTGISSLLTAIILLFVYESPRWMIQKGKIDKARSTMMKIRHINRDRCSTEQQELEHMLRHEQHVFDNRAKKSKKYTFYHLLCTWKYCSWTLTICLGMLALKNFLGYFWMIYFSKPTQSREYDRMTASLVNYGLLFNMEKLSGSLYWNNTFFGIVRWAVNISVGISDYHLEWVGRKLINNLATIYNMLSLAAVCSLFVFGIQGSYSWVIQYATIGVTAMTSQLYMSKFMVASELFPTAIRNLAISSLSCSSRFGTIFAPQLFYLAEITPILPYALLLFLSIVDLILFVAFIPETKGKNLENHLPPKHKYIFYRKSSLLET